MSESNAKGPSALVVITGDPALTSRSRGACLVTSWDHRILVEAFQQSPQGFFIVDGAGQCQKADGHREAIMNTLRIAAESIGCNYQVVQEPDVGILGQLNGDDVLSQNVGDLVSTSHRAGGLIISDCSDVEKSPHLSAMLQSRHRSFEVLEVPSYQSSDWDHIQELASSAADRAAQLIVEAKNVLLVPVQSNTAEQESNAIRGMAVVRPLLDVLRMINAKPRYLIVDGQHLSTIVASMGLRMRRATIRGHTVHDVPVWVSDEPTSKWMGVPFMPYCNSAVPDSALSELTKLSDPCQSSRAMDYQRLGRSALKVSRIVLGCMSFGDPHWAGSPWILPESQALPLLKKAYDLGINTWDTANTYSNGQSEVIIGKALRHYEIPRSRVVIMSKLYYPVMDDSSRPVAVNDGPLVNQMGLSRKHIFDAVQGSLRRLNTDYIDVLQLHRLDRDAEPEEIMGALHDLVKMGKVH